MIEIKNVSKSFGKNKVLNNISFNVGCGKICGLLGLNGAGKSTLMKIICKLVFPDHGEIILNGIKNTQRGSNQKVGFMIESPAFYGELSGRSNLEVFSALYPSISSKRIDAVMKLTGIAAKGEVVYSKYSIGMKQRLYFAYALLNDPAILILDEPFNGIDPVSIKLFEELIKRFAMEGGTVLISGHIISELEKICDCAVIIDDGRIKSIIPDLSNVSSLEKCFLSLVNESGDVQ